MNSIFLIFIARGVILFFSLVIDMVIARLVGVEERGEYIVFVTTTSTLCVFFIFGLQNSITLFESQHLSATGSIDTGVLRKHVGILCPLLVLASLAPFVIPGEFTLGRPVLVAFTVVIMLLVLFFRSFVLAANRDTAYLSILLAERIVVIASVLFCVFVAAAHIIVSYLLAQSVLLVLIALVLLNIFRASSTSSNSECSYGKILAYSSQSFLGNVFFFLLTRVGVFIIQHELDANSVSIFMVGVYVASVFQQFSVFFSTFIFRDSAKGVHLKSILQIALAITAAGTLLAGAAAFFSGTIIKVFYGERYLAAGPPLNILLFGSVAFSGAIILLNGLLGKGRSILYSSVTGLFVLVNITLTIALIGRFQLIGAALGVTVANTLLFVSCCAIYWFLLGRQSASGA